MKINKQWMEKMVWETCIAQTGKHCHSQSQGRCFITGQRTGLQK